MRKKKNNKKFIAGGTPKYRAKLKKGGGGGLIFPSGYAYNLLIKHCKIGLKLNYLTVISN